MVLESGRRAALAHLWRRAAVPAAFTVAFLAVLAWRLLGWDWLTPLVSVAVFGSTMLIAYDDVFHDRIPRGLPSWLRPAWSAAWRNGTLVLYPIATVLGIMAAHRLGYGWIVCLAIIFGLATVFETTVLALTRWLPDPDRRRAFRMLGTTGVSAWADLSVTLALTVMLVLHPHDQGAAALHWIIPMFAVAGVVDFLKARHAGWAALNSL